MEVNINDYLDHDEMKDIAINEFRAMAQRTFREEKDVERVIGNAAFGVIYKSVDELMGVDSKQVLAQKITDQINNFSAFHLFNKPDAWNRETNSAYDYLQQCISDNYGNIKSVVENEIGTETLAIIKGSLPDLIKDAVIDILGNKND